MNRTDFSRFFPDAATNQSDLAEGAATIVRIVSSEAPGGFVEIDASSYNAALHELFTGSVPEEMLVIPSGRFIHP